MNAIGPLWGHDDPNHATIGFGRFEDPGKFWPHIDAFVCCAEEIPLVKQKPGHHVPLLDGPPIEDQSLDAAFRFLDEQLAVGRLVLLYCGEGRSRSVSVIVGYLGTKSGEDPGVLLQQIRRLRPAVWPSELTIQSVVRYVSRKRSKPGG